MLNGKLINKTFLTKKLPLSLLFISGIFLLSFIIFSPYIPFNISFNKGSISPQTITSPQYIEIETTKDKEKTKELIEKKLSEIGKIYSINININKEIHQNINSTFTHIEKYKSSSILKEDKELLEKELTFIPNSRLIKILALDPTTLTSLKFFTLNAMESVLENGIQEINKTQPKNPAENMGLFFL
mgnify:CR=1 FL=1